MHWNLQTDDCYQFLSDEIIKLGNVYVNHPNTNGKETKLNFFPAGKLFLFSLPLLVRIDKYLDFLETLDAGQFQLHFKGIDETLAVSRRHLPALREKIQSM